MVVGVDEAGHHDAVGGVDHRDGLVGDRDAGPDLADLAVLDQDVGLREIAHLRIEAQHHPALEKDAAPPLHAGEQRIGRGRLGERAWRQGLRRGAADRETRARAQKAAA